MHLKGVLFPLEANSELDPVLAALAGCIWDTRAWTLQEYFASTVIRFYTGNHTSVISTSLTTNYTPRFCVKWRSQLALTYVSSPRFVLVRTTCELRLASNRVVTRQEDTAYSLFGILGVSMPAIYGEGNKALGRLLETVLHRLGDATILAWTDQASDYNSYLPAEISAYAKDITSLLPSVIEHGQTETTTSTVQLSSIHQESAIQLYDRVVHLPSPCLISSRLSLSCIAFPITLPLAEAISTCGDSTDSRAHLYTATASALGRVEIKTTYELAGLEILVLVDPWIESLIDPIFISPRPDVDTNPRSGQPSKLNRAFCLLVRLRQPFGALLLAPLNHREYKRIATDHSIRAQVRDDIPLEEFLGMVDAEILDIL